MPFAVDQYCAVSQSSTFMDVMASAGYITSELALKDEVVYFYGDEQLQVARGVRHDADLSEVVLPDNMQIHQLSADADFMLSDAFAATRVLVQDDDLFSSRLMRNVRKARQLMPNTRLEVAETRDQYTRALAQFALHNERREGMQLERFADIIMKLADAGMARVLVLRNVTQNTDVGTIAVFHNDTQANLRYTTAMRENCAGHLLHVEVIEYLFEAGFSVVDLSDLEPRPCTKAEAGVNEFKQQFGGRNVQFIPKIN